MVPLPLAPKVIEKKNENNAVFEIEALYPGYGVTVGNSFRRALLSSIEGAAVTEVRVKDVPHEFSTLPGVLEDVTYLLLNLKKLRFKMYGNEPQKALVSVKGEREVKGADFKLPTQLELINKDTHIATLTDKKAELEMEIQVEKGVGYDPVERRKREKLDIGVIALDAIFTPIKKVSFNVENMRVGRRIDFDRLLIEVETDGTIAPEEAFFQASEVLLKHFFLINESLKEKPAEKEPEQKQKEEKEDKETASLEDLGLSTRTINVLMENGIKTAAGLLRRKEETLSETPGLGEKAIEEIKASLKKHGLELKQ